MNRKQKFLTLVLALAVLNTGYLSYRFVALRTGSALPGTGICSLTEFVDCDRVLMTPEARAFFVPNALLGFGFFVGCLIWLLAGRRYAEDLQRHVAAALAFWLGAATLLTFWFIRLLVSLPNLCPLCPWNHLLTYLAFGAAMSNYLHFRRETAPARTGARLAPLIALSTAPLFAVLAAWYAAHLSGFIG